MIISLPGIFHWHWGNQCALLTEVCVWLSKLVGVSSDIVSLVVSRTMYRDTYRIVARRIVTPLRVGISLLLFWGVCLLGRAEYWYWYSFSGHHKTPYAPSGICGQLGSSLNILAGIQVFLSNHVCVYGGQKHFRKSCSYFNHFCSLVTVA